MMYRQQIDDQLDRLYKMARVLKRRYDAIGDDGTFEMLMLYKGKIDSWKRLREKAEPFRIITKGGEVAPFEPRKHLTMAEILAGATLPGGKHEWN